VGVEADTKSGKFSKTAKLEILENWKFNKSGNSTKLEIQQNWKFNKSGNSTIQQKWKFNKNGKTGNATNQDLSQKQQNGNPMKLHCLEFRCPGEQDLRKTMVCSSGTLPPDIPQIWNGRFCTLILLCVFIDGGVRVCAGLGKGSNFQLESLILEFRAFSKRRSSLTQIFVEVVSTCVKLPIYL